MGRHLKQTIYGSFYLVILFLVFGGFYLKFFKSAPTCFDNKKNQNEKGIDCGGSCKNICLPVTILDIKISEVKIFPLGSGNTTLFGVVENPNSDYAIKNFAFSFNIIKANATSSQQIISGHSFIYSNEKAYLIFPNTDYQFSSGDKPDIAIDDLEWAKKENFEKPILVIKDYEVVESEEGIKVEGSIFNDTFSNVSDVRIFAVFKNQYQKVVGASETSVNLKAKALANFTIFHPPIKEFRKELTLIDFSTPPNN